MSDQISKALVKQFHANFVLLSQQKRSRLRNAVREDPINAEDGFYDQIGAADGADITDRHGDTQYATTPHERRKVTPIPWEWADLIDNMDKVRMLGDPQSTYVQAAVAAANRRIDKHIIDAAFGTAYTGKTGSTPVTFPAANVVAVGSGLDGWLTIAKMLKAREIIYGYDVDDEIPLHICCSQRQITDLLKTTEVTSSDYNTVKALVRGEVDQFLGFKFHRSEKLLTDGNGYRRVMAWAEDGILLTVAEDVKTHIDVLPAKRHSVQVRVEMDMGSARMEEEKVVEIKCEEV